MVRVRIELGFGDRQRERRPGCPGPMTPQRGQLVRKQESKPGLVATRLGCKGRVRLGLVTRQRERQQRVPGTVPPPKGQLVRSQESKPRLVTACS